jgi:hypothetical protein
MKHPTSYSDMRAGPGLALVASWVWLLPLIGQLTCCQAAAQLAITEVMSNASISPMGGDDYWELTNFGQEAVDLTDYWFNDGAGFNGAVNLGSLWDSARWNSPRIEAGETVVFVRVRNGLISTPEHFRRWWGDLRLPSQLKILFYSGYGFDNVRDAINLWKRTEEEPRLIQRIELFKSPVGRSLTYDPHTGVFGPFSYQGIGGAFLADTTEDVGSPGVAQGQAAIQIVTAPQDTFVDAGSSCTLHVKATGLPPPTIQWLFQGEPIPGAQSESYTLTTVTENRAGLYSVVLNNGLERIQTAPVSVTVNTQESCARIERAPSDIAVTSYQTAILSVEPRGYPLPTCRWEFEGNEIAGETNHTLRIERVDETLAGRYTVIVSNPLCTTSVTMRLSLEPTPQLAFTEAMVLPRDKHHLQHDAWWELTNTGTNAVNLLGFRWNDNPAFLDGAVTITNEVWLPPNRSAVFVSGMSPEAFRQWWGEENLPQDLAILTFNGNTLSTNGDLVRIWNATALVDEEWLLVSPTIIGSEIGRTLWFDPILARKGASSVEGEHGAFRAAIGGDVGSPGWNPAFPRIRRPRIVGVQEGSNGVRVTWSTEARGRYELWRCTDPSLQNWTLVVSLEATGDSLLGLDTTARSLPHRFYRVIRLP